MDCKILELRDKRTFIPILCVNVAQSDNEGQRYLMRRVGFPLDGHPNIIVTALSADGRPAWNDPYGWGGRTFCVAHNWVIENWGGLKDGDVVDVEFILGESKTSKTSEREIG